VRLRLTVAYDGAPYHGFADNPGVPTVGGTLARTLERVLGHAVELAVAGRTDRGVHAWGQVVSFDTSRTEADLDLDGLRRSVNR
jgi:tRNA pseudouridine38-40 synthase